MRDFPSSNPIDPMPPAEISEQLWPEPYYIIDNPPPIDGDPTMPNINAPSPTIARMDRFVRLVAVIVPIAMLILLVVLLMMPMAG